MLGYVPDHYLTEYAPPDAARRRDLVGELERFRGMGPRDILARALLLGGHSFGSVDLSGAATSAGADLDPAGPVLALATRRCSAARPRSGSPRSSRPAAGCCCTACCPCWTTTAPTARCSRTRSGWPPAPASRAPRTTSRRCAPPTGRATSPRSGSASCSGWRRPARPRSSRSRVDVADGSTGRGRRAPCRRRPGGRRGVRLPVPPRLLARAAGARSAYAGGSRPTAPHPGLVTTTTADASGQRLLHLVNVAPVAQKFALGSAATRWPTAPSSSSRRAAG